MSAEPSRPSRWAGIALALGLVAWLLPLMPAVVIVLAVIALVSARPSAGARRLAVGAFVLGLVGLTVQGVVGFRGYRVYQQLSAGPAAAIARGASGDLGGFSDAADTDTNPARRMAAQHFLAELETRYGSLVGGQAVENPSILETLSGRDTQATYHLEFHDAAVTAEARLLPIAGAQLWDWPARRVVTWVQIDDPDDGPIVFPSLQSAEVQPDVLAH